MNDTFSTESMFGSMFKKLFWNRSKTEKSTYNELYLGQELGGNQATALDGMTQRDDPKVNELETFEQYINIGRIGSSFYYN